MIRIVMRIKEIREKNRVSLRELERRTGIDRHYLSKFEKLSFDKISLSEIFFVAQGLGVRIEDLFEVIMVEII